MVFDYLDYIVNPTTNVLDPVSGSAELTTFRDGYYLIEDVGRNITLFDVNNDGKIDGAIAFFTDRSGANTYAVGNDLFLNSSDYQRFADGLEVLDEDYNPGAFYTPGESGFEQVLDFAQKAYDQVKWQDDGLPNIINP